MSSKPSATNRERGPDRDPGPAGQGRSIRLAAFDLDGTLLGPGIELADSVVRAVGALKARGVTVIIVTGRMHRTAERFARQLGLEGLPLVSFNGAMVRRVSAEPPAADDLWWYRPIATGLGVKVIDFLAGHGLKPLIFDADRVYAAEPGPGAAAYREISGIDPEFVGELRTHVLGGDEGGRPLVRPTKILQVHDPELMPRLHAEARASFGQALTITTSYAFFLEFMDCSVSKGKALAEVCRRLQIDAAQVAAFGDGLNDLEMIRWAGLGVAMGHGSAELIQAADAVAEGPPGEGVARYIEENLL